VTSCFLNTKLTLSRKIGILAKQMIFTGEQISADVAERWGLVNEVQPAMAVSSLRLPTSSRSRAGCGKPRSCSMAKLS
jgi:enoyl-CoA hydratase/carnithine racemase